MRLEMENRPSSPSKRRRTGKSILQNKHVTLWRSLSETCWDHREVSKAEGPRQ